MARNHAADGLPLAIRSLGPYAEGQRLCRMKPAATEKMDHDHLRLADKRIDRRGGSVWLSRVPDPAAVPAAGAQSLVHALFRFDHSPGPCRRAGGVPGLLFAIWPGGAVRTSH